MSEKKELNLEELENVNGGCGDKDMAKYLPSNHGGHIGKYEAEGYINSKVYVIRDIDRECYYWGTLLESYEDSRGAGSERVHKVQIEGCNDYFSAYSSYIGYPRTFSGDEWTLFLME